MRCLSLRFWKFYFKDKERKFTNQILHCAVPDLPHTRKGKAKRSIQCLKGQQTAYESVLKDVLKLRKKFRQGQKFISPPKDPDGFWLSTSLLQLLRTANYPRGNCPGHAPNHSNLSSAEVKNAWSFTSIYRVLPWRVQGRLYNGLVATNFSVIQRKYLDNRQYMSPFYSKLILSPFAFQQCTYYSRCVLPSVSK
jgi:hypothetical protein